MSNYRLHNHLLLKELIDGLWHEDCCKETLCNDFYGHDHPKTNKTVGKLVELYILYSDSIQKTIFKLFHNAINKIDNGNPFYITLTIQNHHVYLKPMCDILVNKIANIKLINDIDANKNHVNRGRGRIKKVYIIKKMIIILLKQTWKHGMNLISIIYVLVKL